LAGAWISIRVSRGTARITVEVMCLVKIANLGEQIMSVRDSALIIVGWVSLSLFSGALAALVAQTLPG